MVGDTPMSQTSGRRWTGEACLAHSLDTRQAPPLRSCFCYENTAHSRGTNTCSNIFTAKRSVMPAM